MEQERVGRERDFHDARFTARVEGDDPRAAALKFYAAATAARDAYRDRLGAGAGVDVLEYGCGTASEGFDLAAQGAAVTAIDISPAAIDISKEEAERRGVELTFREMNAEALDFPENSFDLVCGSSILHHLEIDVAIREITRVLRPDGHAVFLEPLGHNPLINLYRKRTPEMRTPDEHPLLMSDLEDMQRPFGHLDAEYFELLTLAAAPFMKYRFGEGLSHVLTGMDRRMFRAIPPMRRHAWFVVLDLREPVAVPPAAGIAG